MSADLVAASPFDAIRHVTGEGREYWSARALMSLLGYEKWERFAEAISRAKIAARNAGYDPATQFPGAGKMVPTGSGARRTIEDYHLSRYACYLVAPQWRPAQARDRGRADLFRHQDARGRGRPAPDPPDVRRSPPGRR